jgi:hypothetical protein
MQGRALGTVEEARPEPQEQLLERWLEPCAVRVDAEISSRAERYASSEPSAGEPLSCWRLREIS